MARITVEDCLEKVNNQYELVLLAKERTSQLNAGEKHLVPENNDKKTVIALREIGEGKVSPETLENLAVNKLRKNPDIDTQDEDGEEIQKDEFENIYKGEVSKSGTAILPSKRARQVNQKIEIAKKPTETESGQQEEIIKQEENKNISAEKKSE